METGYEFVEAPRQGMLLTGVDADAPFARAGLRDGGIVTRIAGERIKDNDDVSDGLHKAIQAETFELEVCRAGEKIEVAVRREFRAATGPLPELVVAATNNQSTTTTIVQNDFSIAEELARFAALREQGLLTDAEFQAQKARLLDPTDPVTASAPPH